MFIEKVHGLQATGISLNNRFTMLASAAPNSVTPARTPRKRASIGNFLNQTLNNRNLIEQIARKLQQQVRRQTIKQRLGMAGPMRRYGSESSLPGLRRSNSFGSFNQRQNLVRAKVAWRQSNNNLSRSGSIGNLSQGTWRGRGFRRRGGVGQIRGRMRGGRMQFGRATYRAPNRSQSIRRRMRGGRGRGGVVRNQANQKPLPTKEELDAQLDQYMASTKTALDKELDAYMKSAMELE